EHAGMPVLGPQDDRVALRPAELALDPLAGLTLHALVELAAARVVLVQTLGQGARLLGIAGAEQPQRLQRAAHAARRVESRRELERHLTGADALALEPRDLDQRLQAEVVGARQPLQTGMHQESILVR